MRTPFTKCHGSGNDFPLIDARAIALVDGDWATIARVLADRSGPVGGDGLLLLTGGEMGMGMRMFNSDGSEAETCLNGLRCVARLGFGVMGVDAARVTLKTSSAEVARAPDLAPGVVTVRTSAQAVAGEAAIGLTGPLSDLPSDRAFTAVAMPNPHLVSFVDAVDETELVALGDYCEAGPALLPNRANVSFVESRGADLFVRTYERGVGLTDSCGSAMAAAVFAAARNGRVPWDREIRVFNQGGLVRGSAATDGTVTILGNATFLYDAEIDIDLTTGTASGLVRGATYEGEAAAWAAAVAALA